ncbi:hypothetical protein GDO86_008055 [Hymenochirus boettgeri]|uniref:Spermatogenesis-associated protein 1 C-terminal domain-containing protein n=1 Tax=Hymenochirus boettgeri TaxID=247094 RepID=A0A8T2J3F2_9PIPI|nr:hypothetical protein GDO86_008055 [Hymenochirus boettgeri]
MGSKRPNDFLLYMNNNQSLMTANSSRPSTAGLIELHVYQVPDDVWNFKLNSVSTDVINRFISVGFIRVSPDMQLRTLRERLGEFLGEDIVLDKFVFLKCVGRSLAVVKAKQERELKLKSFAPPYASQPELYLLPRAENEGSTYGSSVISDDTQYSNQYNSSDSSISMVAQQTGIQSLNHLHSEQIHKDLTLPKEEKDNGTFLFTRQEEEIVKNINVMRLESQDQNKERHISLMVKDRVRILERNQTGDSGVPESLEGRDIDHLHNKSSMEPSVAMKTDSIKMDNQVHKFGGNYLRHLPEPAHYQAPPSPPPLLDFPTIKSLEPRDKSHRETIDQLKEERMHLEKSREELVKKAKSLIEQYKLKRHRARDSWKKKYYETKKVTAILEERLNKLRNEFEVYHQKLMTQLAARDSRKQLKNPTLAANSKNAVIMSITTKQHELDQLKHRVENARIKLLIEIKMRKQASSELNVLKAELAQKKAQSTLHVWQSKLTV